MKLEPVRLSGVLGRRDDGAIVISSRLHPHDNGHADTGMPFAPAPMRSYIPIDVASSERLPESGFAAAEGTIEWNPDDIESLHTVMTSRLSRLADPPADEWKIGLLNDRSGFAALEMSEELLAARSVATSANPLPYSSALELEVDASHKSIDKSGLFDTAYSFGGRYIPGHGYAASVGVLIVTEPMRQYLSEVGHKICLTPLIQRIRTDQDLAGE